MPRGDTLVALDTFVAPVTLDGGVPFHPRVLHHLREGREGYQGRQWNHAPGPRVQRTGRLEEPEGPVSSVVEDFWMQSSSLPGHRAKQSRLKSFPTLPVPASHTSPAIPLPCRTHWRSHPGPQGASFLGGSVVQGKLAGWGAGRIYGSHPLGTSQQGAFRGGGSRNLSESLVTSMRHRWDSGRMQ